MLPELERHPHARAVLAPALENGRLASHAYLFHGPGGTGKRSVARALAAELLADAERNPRDAHRRAMSGAHPDLTWIAPAGAHEILVGDIDAPVVAAATRTPFESSRRVFVIERAHELGPEAANRMLKTLEEPAAFVHLILLTDRLGEILPTIRSRCQLARFDAAPEAETAASLEAIGVERDTALACVRLALGDAAQASDLAGEQGAALRAAAQRFARSALGGRTASEKPWSELLSGVRAQGDSVRVTLEARAADEVAIFPRQERKRIESEWAERIRRARRRGETASLDLALQLVALWYRDLACLAWAAPELVHHVDRRSELAADLGPEPSRLRAAIELVEDARRRLQLNVSEALACEALAYRVEATLA